MFQDSRELQRWESDQRIMTQAQRDIEWWMRKHPGACPQCGSYDGMMSYYPDEIELLLDFDVELDAFGWYRLPDHHHAVYTPCTECITDVSAYEPVSFEWVLNWYEERNESL